MNKLIVCGGRDFSDILLFTSVMDRTIRRLGDNLTIVHGGCKSGADLFAKRYANDNGYEQIEYPADWAKSGKAAGPMRNEEMAKDGAVLVLAFWDGVSSGTKDMISRSIKNNIPVYIQPYNQ